MENRVVGPAIGLIAYSAFSGLLGVLGIIINIFSAGCGAFLNNIPGSSEIPPQVLALLSGTFGVISGIIGLAIAGFVLYAALKMKNLESHTLAVVASILTMLSCSGGCCCLGLPLGIWALVVLLDKDVKACFKS